MNAISEMMNAVPAIVRVMVVFGLMLIAIKRKWSLGNTFVAGSLAMGALFTMAPTTLLKTMGASALNPSTLSLAIVVSLILILSHSLEKSGQMSRMLDGFKGLIRRPQLNLVIFPALIGLLPMPGGAIFSAPMVKNLGQDHPLTDTQLSYINYWYRHIWEYWWPLYPGILLTTTLAGMDLWHLVAYTFPLTFVAVAAGYWPLRGSAAISPKSQVAAKSVRPFLQEIVPVAIAIVLGLGMGVIFSEVLAGTLKLVAKEIGLIVALIVAVAWVWRTNALPLAQCRDIIRQPTLLNMVYMIVAILVFRGVLEQSSAVVRISREMVAWHIPIIAITILLPFLVGTLTGITIAFVGVSFPILVSLIQAMGQTPSMPAYMMLALVSGFAGVLVSPLHLCLQLSNHYFHTALTALYSHMRIPLAALITTAILYFGALRYCLG